MSNATRTRRQARTSTFPHTFAHPGEYYRAPLTSNVRELAEGRPFGWGLIKEEQLGCSVASRLLDADLDITGRRIIRSSVAKALYATACFGFNRSQPILHVAGLSPSYRNVRLPRLDLDLGLDAEDRQHRVIETLDGQVEREYPDILRAIEIRGGLVDATSNARRLGECSLQLAAVSLVELELPIVRSDVQDFVAMTANSLKTEVARSITHQDKTPSVRQFIHRGSPMLNELIGHPNPEVSDLALEVCLDL